MSQKERKIEELVVVVTASRKGLHGSPQYCCYGSAAIPGSKRFGRKRCPGARDDEESEKKKLETTIGE